MQLNDQADFNQRMVFYSSFPVQNLVKKGNGKPGEPELYYTFPHVYVIGITDFIMSGVPDTSEMINSYSIRNEKHLSNPLTDKVTYVTVELPKLTKTLAELSSPEDFTRVHCRAGRSYQESSSASGHQGRLGLQALLRKEGTPYQDYPGPSGYGHRGNRVRTERA